MTIVIANHPHLSREICFKSVESWITDAAREHGLEVRRWDGVSVVAGTDLFLVEPVIFSPFTEPGAPEATAVLPWPDGKPVIPHTALPVGTLPQLVAARNRIQWDIAFHHLAHGVDILDPFTTTIAPDAQIGAGTTILPGCVIQSNVTVGINCTLGPFLHLRPGSVLGADVRLGAFVEVKNSTLGAKTHASHLTYIGDTDTGKNVAFGCGAVTVNYNGAEKFRTQIEDNAFIGCNTNLVAPVTIGKDAFTAAGSTVTEDVPAGNLAIARQRQTNKSDWEKPKK